MVRHALGYTAPHLTNWVSILHSTLPMQHHALRQMLLQPLPPTPTLPLPLPLPHLNRSSPALPLPLPHLNRSSPASRSSIATTAAALARRRPEGSRASVP